jgi:hypothetical protein
MSNHVRREEFIASQSVQLQEGFREFGDGGLATLLGKQSFGNDESEWHI